MQWQLLTIGKEKFAQRSTDEYNPADSNSTLSEQTSRVSDCTWSHDACGMPSKKSKSAQHSRSPTQEKVGEAEMGFNINVLAPDRK